MPVHEKVYEPNYGFGILPWKVQATSEAFKSGELPNQVYKDTLETIQRVDLIQRESMARILYFPKSSTYSHILLQPLSTL